MLEKPNIADETIIACLREHYDLVIAQLEFLPIGYDATAWVYRAETDAETFFLKLKKGTLNEASLLVPHFLKTNGVSQIVAPIANNQPSLWTNCGDFNLILYPFVEGKTGMEAGLSDNQWLEFGNILRHIHATPITPALAQTLQRETFIPQWANRVREIDTHIALVNFSDSAQKELAQFWQSKHTEIMNILERTLEIGRKLQSQSLPFVLCHSDIHTANVLVDAKNKLYIVDWDEVRIAPKERDLLFVDAGGSGGVAFTSQQGQLFFKGYGDTQINPLVIAYYRYEWVVQEIGDFGERVFFDTNAGDETRTDSVRGFKKLFAHGDVVTAAYTSVSAFNFRNYVMEALYDFWLIPENSVDSVTLEWLLLHYYNRFNRKLTLAKQNPSDHNIRGLSEVLFVVAVGLFTYGHGKMFKEILENKPSRSNVRTFAGCLRTLTPLPQHLDPRTDKDVEETLSWFNENITQLQWNENLLVFEWNKDYLNKG
jgi:spectinomycin phosphotransferase